MWSRGGIAGAGARDDGEEGEADDGAPPAPPHAGPAGTAAGGRPGQGELSLSPSSVGHFVFQALMKKDFQKGLITLKLALKVHKY